MLQKGFEFDLDNVAKEHVGLAIFLLHHLKLVAQAQAVQCLILHTGFFDMISIELDASINQVVGSTTFGSHFLCMPPLSVHMQ